ncbi:NAD(P)H-hydrate epimerase [Streptomyces lavendulae]|uniref:NAD(P)H-hydrate epimerase n=1 Tax=Streptomyces lavendulae TaxID=1914 RepID=UPI00371DE1FC
MVLAGPGDNGGDALYAGARLARRGARRAIPVEYPQKGLQPRPAVRIDLRVRKVNGSVSHSVVTESREGR